MRHDHLHVFVDEAEARSWAAEEPRSFEELWWGKRLAGVRVVLASAPRHVVGELIEDAWRRKAPPRVVAAYDAAPR